jgi:hypothetical protein
MLRLVVLLCLGTLCAAKIGKGPSHCCTAGDRKVVQEQWHSLWENVQSSRLKIGFGRLLITKLVEKHPELKEPFAAVDIANPDSGKFQAYSLRVLEAFDVAITLLDDAEGLEAALDRASEVWSKRKGFTTTHFKTLGGLLKNGLERMLEDFDPMAWKACLGGIFKGIAAKLPPT